jgi:hypothetical protein
MLIAKKVAVKFRDLLMTRNSIKPLIFGVILVAIYSGIFVAYMGRSFPVVGHDFSFFMPRLIDTYLHYSINGFTIQWYSPSFGGGTPAYASAQSMQFSLLQLFTSFFDPWRSTCLSVIIYLAVGFSAGYFFLRKLISLEWTASLLGALLFVANGFYIQHISVGHLSFLAFPLLPVILYYLFRENRSFIFEGLMISIVIAFIFYSGGIYILTIFIFCLMIMMPLLYVFRSQLFVWRLMGLRSLVGISWALGLILSKLWAAIAYLRLFPREIYYTLPISWLDGLSGIVGQLLGTMTLAPYYWLTQRNLIPFSQYFSVWIGKSTSLWEFDISLSPILWFLIMLGLYWMLVDLKHPIKLTFQQHVAILVLILVLIVEASYITTKGLGYFYLKMLPGVASLNVPWRFTSALVYPLSIIGAISYNRLIRRSSSRKQEIILTLFSTIVFIFILPYYRVPELFTGQWFNAQSLIGTYYSIKKGYSPMVDQILDVRDADAIQNEASSLYPHDPMFGYGASNYKPEISVGPVDLIEYGYFNINNASGFLYPELNNTRPFERIKVGEKEYFYDFIQRRQPAWKRPTSQYVADSISFICLLTTIFFLLSRMMKIHLPNRSI